LRGARVPVPHGDATEYGDITSREIGANGRTTDGRTDVLPENIMPLSAYTAGGGSRKMEQ